MGPHDPDDIAAVAAVADLVPFVDTRRGLQLGAVPCEPDVEAAVTAFRNAAARKCWAVLNYNNIPPFLLCHIGAGWRVARALTDQQLQDAFLVLAGVAPSAKLRESIPWVSVPSYMDARDLLDKPVNVDVPTMLVPVLVTAALAAGATIEQTNKPLTPVRV